MAVDAFLYLKVPIGKETYQPVGETTDATYSQYCAFEIKDFSFDVEHGQTIGSATTGAGGGKVKFGEFTCKRTTDFASTVFFRNCCAGMHYSSAVIAIRKPGEDMESAGKPYLWFAFGMLFTTKVDWSGPGDEGPEESVTFAFGQFGVRYLKQTASGSLSVTKQDASWDQTKNKPWVDFGDIIDNMKPKKPS
jgi:type VI protein secretion system component Hcp